MKLIVTILFFFVTQFPLFAQDTTYTSTYRIGATRIQVITTCYNECIADISFINVHENERTSVEAAEEFLRTSGGSIMQLKHSGERNISFYLDKKRYTFDPNRIYTRTGTIATLRNNGPYSSAALKRVESLSQQILKQYVDGKKLIVALHNNTDKNYSINSYSPGGNEAQNAAEVYINPEMDEDDFIVTTEKKIFDQVREKQINVVLQDNKRVIDDGSLSVYAAKKNIPYINIEAQEGHYYEQLDLLKAIEDIIYDYTTRKVPSSATPVNSKCF